MAEASITGIASSLCGLFLHLSGQSINYGPDCPDAKAWLQKLSEGQFFELDRPVYDAAFNLRDTWQTENRQAVDFGGIDPEELLTYPSQAELPSPITFLHLPTLIGEAQSLVACYSTADKAINCFILAVGALPVRVGHFIPGASGGVTALPHSDDAKDRASVLQLVAMALVLINEPRFTIRISAGSRQVRRAAGRGKHMKADCWHKITWKIDRPAEVKDGDQGGGWKVAYHWKRAHWRKAESTWANVSWLPASEVNERPAGFYQRIPDSYPGDPRLGIVKSVHAPRLSSFFKPKAEKV